MSVRALRPLGPPPSPASAETPAGVTPAPTAESASRPSAGPGIPPITLDALLHRADLWRGAQLAGSTAATIASGFAVLDAELPGGGWPAGALVELMPGSAATYASQRDPARAGAMRGNGALSLLLPAIARLTRAGRWVALIAPPLPLHAPALLQHGIDLAHLLHVATADAQERNWASERCLRSGAVAATIVWPGMLSFTARKRLQLAAEAGGGSGFLMLPAAAADQSSPAPLRLTITAQASGAALHILKRRGPRCDRPIVLPLARPLPARKRNTPATESDHALARPLATRPAADRAPRPAAA
ncbi:MAG TPA: SOS cell division inhibitor [Rhodocyclaceae bacterium]